MTSGRRKRFFTRRRILTGGGVCIPLPFLRSRPASAGNSLKPKFLAINFELGLQRENFKPRDLKDHTSSVYLREFSKYRDRLSVITGTSHPGVSGGHLSDKSFLTAAPFPSSADFRNTVSIDQLLAREVGGATRFPSLAASLSGHGMSWSNTGVRLPSFRSPHRLFESLFVSNKKSVHQVRARLAEGRSILDFVQRDLKNLNEAIGYDDRSLMVELEESIRETEKRLMRQERWSEVERPSVAKSRAIRVYPRDDILGQFAGLLDGIRLAFITDSTRIVTLCISAMGVVPKLEGVSDSYHNLSHHGKSPEKIAQLTKVESSFLRQILGFIVALDAHDAGSTILEDTVILVGSNLGNANSHSTTDLPLMMFGGKFRHGREVRIADASQFPASELFVDVLRHFGSDQPFGDRSAGLLAS